MLVMTDATAILPNIAGSELFPALTAPAACPSGPPLGCRLLWFAGMSEGFHAACTATEGGYAQAYAAALGSAPRDLLEPVLMLTRRLMCQTSKCTGLSARGRA